MAARTYRVGDVVAWDEVPDGALVLSVSKSGWHWWYRRAGETGDVVGLRRGTDDTGVFWPASERLPQWRDAATWKGWSPDEHQVTIVALDLAGQETAADLRRLAEIYEVREALRAEPGSLVGFWRVWLGEPFGPTGAVMLGGFSGSRDAALQVWAERLHATGWRPGDSAARAAELLAAEGRA